MDDSGQNKRPYFPRFCSIGEYFGHASLKNFSFVRCEINQKPLELINKTSKLYDETIKWPPTNTENIQKTKRLELVSLPFSALESFFSNLLMKNLEIFARENLWSSLETFNFHHKISLLS